MTQEILLPLAMLYANGKESVEGATRFQKLVFLSQKETDVEKTFMYRSDDFGPFSKELHAALEELENRGIIDRTIRTNRSGKETYIYTLTGFGERIIEQIQENNDAEEFEDLLEQVEKTKSEYNNIPLDRLLQYVYSNHRNYTNNSKLDNILEKLPGS
ncbi:PadR family transcriptional regulator [Halostagnicola sp. A-GB9-2]|uniref:PadR family transcriptional regulator n=1 Tax=Halostagnicola sp. A-GB9-2 TaxID=3048066 RepID=UPI0024C0D8B0|nr:PadR family transcriptional regulator [Halostagnicola sp. A-GB9-2]MDJ1433972.1 PadR family transcriptional regulator [Halostagnicola sp. A-GB9-2]